MNNFDFLGPNLPKNGFWGRKVKNLSLDLESAPPKHHFQILVKMDNFEFFDLNLGKLPNYVRYFGSNIDKRVPESWVEAEMSWVEAEMSWVKVGGRLKWAGWRWMELGGGGLHGLVIPFNISINIVKFFDFPRFLNSNLHLVR